MEGASWSINIQQCAVLAMCCEVRGRHRDGDAPYPSWGTPNLTGIIDAQHENLRDAIQCAASSPSFSGRPHNNPRASNCFSHPVEALKRLGLPCRACMQHASCSACRERAHQVAAGLRSQPAWERLQANHGGHAASLPSHFTDSIAALCSVIPQGGDTIPVHQESTQC